jgi:hypothetical protein
MFSPEIHDAEPETGLGGRVKSSPATVVSQTLMVLSSWPQIQSKEERREIDVPTEHVMSWFGLS